MRKRVTKSNRWKKVVTVAKESAKGAGAGMAGGAALGFLQGSQTEGQRLARAKPAFIVKGKEKEFDKVSKYAKSKAGGARAVSSALLGAGVGTVLGAARGLRKILAKRRLKTNKIAK